jgi:hypothetical protein
MESRGKITECVPFILEDRVTSECISVLVLNVPGQITGNRAVKSFSSTWKEKIDQCKLYSIIDSNTFDHEIHNHSTPAYSG